MVLIQLLLVAVFGINSVLLQADVPPLPIDLAPPPPPLDLPPIAADPPPVNDEVITDIVNEAADPLVGNTTVDDVNNGDTIIDLNINETVTISSNDSSADASNQTDNISALIGDVVANATDISNNVTSDVNETASAVLNATVPDILSELSNNNSTDSNFINDAPKETQNTSSTNATDVKSFLDITAEFDKLTGNASDNATQTDTNISDTVPLDPFLFANPVDLPPPPISPLDFGLGDELLDIASNANVSENVDKALNGTLADPFADSNKTSVDSFDPFLTDMQPSNATDASVTPVDVPLPPFDMPSFNVNETGDTTTIEISEFMLNQLSQGINEITPVLTNESTETSTVPMDYVTTGSPFTEPSSPETTTRRTRVTRPEPVVAPFAPIGDTPDHPPPIIFGRKPSVYTDNFGPVSAHFEPPKAQTTQKPSTPLPPPPPIEIKSQPDGRATWLDQVNVTPPSSNVVGGKQVNGLNPRYMNVAELAEYALKASGTRPATQKRPGYQVYYPTQPAYTTPVPTTTTLSPTVVGGYPRAYQASAFIEYLEKKYGITNPVSPPRRQMITTPKPVNKARPFFDSNYLLSQIAQYNKPTTSKSMPPPRFNDANSFLSQTTQRPPSRPVTASPASKPKPRFFDSDYLLSHLGELSAKPLVNQQQPNQPQRPVYQEPQQSKPQPTPNIGPAQSMPQRPVYQEPSQTNQQQTQTMPQRPVYQEPLQTNQQLPQTMPQRPVYQEPPQTNQQQPQTMPQRPVYQEPSQTNQQQPQTMPQRPVYQEPPQTNQQQLQTIPQRPVYQEPPQTIQLQPQTMPQRPVYQEPPQTNRQIPQTMPQRPVYQDQSLPLKPKSQPTQVNVRPFGSNMNSIKPSAFNQIANEQFNGLNVLKEQRSGQTDTRPLHLEAPVNPQSFVDYTVNPERNFRMNINLKNNMANVGQNQQPQAEVSPNVVMVPHTAQDFSRFKPVVYGNEQIQTQQVPQAFDVKSRFNRKWYHPEDKRGIKPVRVAPVDLNIIKGDTVKSRETPGVDFQTLFGAMFNQGSQQNSQNTFNGAGPRQHTFQQQHQQNSNQQQNPISFEQQQILRQQQAFKEQIQRQQQLIQQQQHQQEAARKEQEALARQQKLKEQSIVDRQQQHQESYFLIQQQKQEEARRALQQQKMDELNRNHQLRSLRGQTEILPSTVNQPMVHNFKPTFPVSSITIFKPSNFPDRSKRSQQPIQYQPFQNSQDNKLNLETRWQAEVGHEDIHGHVPVPQTVRIEPLQSARTVKPIQNVDVTITTLPPQTVGTTLPPTLPPRPTTPTTTTTTQRTPPPTADPNPPAIFDIKVKHTFMPMPKIDPTTKSPISSNGTAAGWSGSQNNGQIDERCQGCVYINDRCLLPDPVHCSKYIECVRQGSMIRAFSRRCALSSFFDRKSFLCVDPKNADCPTDRCRVPGTKWYPIEGHCKHYWQCAMREGGGVYAQSQCCPDMGGFIEGEGCVENPNCTESCESIIMQDAPTGCQLRKTASPTVYFDGNANIERPCAPGTVFNELACTCVQDVTIERNTPSPGDGSNCTCGNQTTCLCGNAMQSGPLGDAICRPSLALTFDGGVIEDQSNTNQHLGNEGISVTLEGEAVSNGASKLVLWRYANHMFPLVMAVRFRFLSTSNSPRIQTIFTNCDPKGGIEPSLEISLDTLYHEVLFKVNSLNGAPKRFSIIYTQNQWSQVDVIYDGERIVGAVDRRARNIFAGGGIETRPSPISVGSCRDKDGFKGLLDDVYLYEDCIPDDMYGIFMSVLE